VIEARILVASEDDYRTYAHAVARAIRELRPHAQVASTDLGTLEEEAARLDPHLVILCSQPGTADTVGSPVSWVELSPHPERPWRICVGQRCWESLNPTLEELLSVVDETERLAKTTRESGNR
jgi:hypothetical protein